MLHNALRSYGLEENEARVYLTLLELGPATVTEITKKAQITRTLGYSILERLGLLGLVTRTSGSEMKRRYIAEHPRSFLQYVKNRKNQWERNVASAEQLLPDLVALYKDKEKPVIRYQEGTQGVTRLYEESLQATGEIISVTDVECWQDPELWDWARSYNRNRNKLKIKERILLLDTPQGREWIRTYRPSPYTVYRWVTKDQAKGLMQFGGELTVYDNNVVIALPQRPNRMTAIIESSVLANILRALFEIVWDVATPVSYKKR